MMIRCHNTWDKLAAQLSRDKIHARFSKEVRKMVEEENKLRCLLVPSDKSKFFENSFTAAIQVNPVL
jgi:hypothetical protein